MCDRLPQADYGLWNISESPLKSFHQLTAQFIVSILFARSKDLHISYTKIGEPLLLCISSVFFECVFFPRVRETVQQNIDLVAPNEIFLNFFCHKAPLIERNKTSDTDFIFHNSFCTSFPSKVAPSLRPTSSSNVKVNKNLENFMLELSQDKRN